MHVNFKTTIADSIYDIGHDKIVCKTCIVSSYKFIESEDNIGGSETEQSVSINSVIIRY